MPENEFYKGTIVYIGNFEMPDKNAAAHRVLNVAKILSEIGYKVVFCGIDKSIKVNSIKPEHFDGFESWPRTYPKNSREWFSSLTDFTFLHGLLDKYTELKFVFAYNLHALQLKALLGYCRKRNVKIIADLTEWYENYFSLNPIRFIKWVDTVSCMRFLYAKTDGIIVISKFLQRFYDEKKCCTVLLPPLVDLHEEKWKIKSSEQDNEIVQFVYTGVPGKFKDKVGIIIKCFAELGIKQDYLFKIIGLTKEQFILDNPEYIEYLNCLAKRIVFAGRVSHVESIKSLKESDYCIFVRDSSRKNNAGFPTKFVECITSGIGIIVNRFSNLEDYFPSKDSIMLPDSDEDSIKKGILFAINNGKVEHEGRETFDYRKYIDVIDKFMQYFEQ